MQGGIFFELKASWFSRDVAKERKREIVEETRNREQKRDVGFGQYSVLLPRATARTKKTMAAERRPRRWRRTPIVELFGPITDSEREKERRGCQVRRQR